MLVDKEEVMRLLRKLYRRIAGYRIVASIDFVPKIQVIAFKYRGKEITVVADKQCASLEEAAALVRSICPDRLICETNNLSAKDAIRQRHIWRHGGRS